ncbi:hypothetical protein [Dactylosporangium cerinum]
MLAGLVQAAGRERRGAQVPQRLRPGRGVVGPGGPFEEGDRSLVVAPDDLVQAADPEQGLGLAAHVACRPEQCQRALEQRQLGRILDRRRVRPGPLVQEPPVQDLPAGQGGGRLQRVEFALGPGQRLGVTGVHRALIE